jgi:hypothetical protein
MTVPGEYKLFPPCSSRRVLLSFFLCGVYWLGPSPISSQETSKSLLERFNAEAPSAWKRAEEADEWPATLKVTKKVSENLGKGWVYPREKEAIIRRKPGFYLFEAVTEKNDGRVIEGFNPHYSFAIAKAGGKSGWRLHELKIKNQKGYGKIPDDLFEFLKPNSYGFLPTLGPLSAVVKSKRFKAARAEQLSAGLVRIHFQTAILGPQAEINVTGWMDFDPNNM